MFFTLLLTLGLGAVARAQCQAENLLNYEEGLPLMEDQNLCLPQVRETSQSRRAVVSSEALQAKLSSRAKATGHLAWGQHWPCYRYRWKRADTGQVDTSTFSTIPASECYYDERELRNNSM